MLESTFRTAPPPGGYTKASRAGSFFVRCQLQCWRRRAWPHAHNAPQCPGHVNLLHRRCKYYGHGLSYGFGLPFFTHQPTRAATLGVRTSAFLVERGRGCNEPAMLLASAACKQQPATSPSSAERLVVCSCWVLLEAGDYNERARTR
jgi:hypothetical protein